MPRPALALLRTIAPAQTLALAALTLASALTEGLGLLILVPMLAVLSGSAMMGAMPDWVARVSGELVGSLGLEGLLLLFVALIAARAVLTYRLALMQMQTEHAMVDRWRSDIHRALLRADWRNLANMRQSDNSSLLISLVDHIGEGFFHLFAVASGLVTLALLWLAAMALSPAVALAGLLGGGLVLALFVRFRRRARSSGDAMMRHLATLHGEAQEGLGALRLIKTHGQEEMAQDRFGHSVRSMRGAQLALLRTTAGSRAFLLAGGALVMALVVWLAAAQGVAIAVLLPVIALFARCIPLLLAVQQGLQQWAHAQPAIERAERVIADARAFEEPVRSVRPAPEPVQAIAVQGITVVHPGRAAPALADVSLVLPVGSMTALVGPSGSGKSTLADVFGGLFAPDAGTLAIDGTVLDGAARVDWRRAVAYLHQEPVLFHTSIRQNLAWARPDADETAMIAALEKASARFVLDLPEGLDTVVGDAGRTLSGGERQRIALARALLDDPALLILDEATSALDAENDAAIARAIAALKGSRTILVIGHRGALTDLADTVVTLRDGRIVGPSAAAGRPDEPSAS